VIGPRDAWPRKYARPSRRHELLLGTFFVGGSLLFWASNASELPLKRRGNHMSALGPLRKFASSVL
jgi:hypothetical protein